jgi:hypothetical protein
MGFESLRLSSWHKAKIWSVLVTAPWKGSHRWPSQCTWWPLCPKTNEGWVLYAYCTSSSESHGYICFSFYKGLLNLFHRLWLGYILERRVKTVMAYPHGIYNPLGKLDHNQKPHRTHINSVTRTMQKSVQRWNILPWPGCREAEQNKKSNTWSWIEPIVMWVNVQGRTMSAKALRQEEERIIQSGLELPLHDRSLTGPGLEPNWP